MSRVQIDLGDIECNTGTPVDGVLWTCGWPEGWDSAEQEGGSLKPTGRDGGAGLANWWKARQLVVNGRCKASTEAQAWAAFNLVVSGLPGIRGEMDVVVHETTAKGLTVVQHGNPRANPRGITADRSFTWQLSLRADNPNKTALTATTTSLAASASATLTNNGTTAAYPVITTTSSGTVDLVIGGRHFTTASVVSGVVIDMWARTLVDGSGDPIYAAKTPESEWLALPVGGTSVTNSGTAALSISFYDTY